MMRQSVLLSLMLCLPATLASGEDATQPEKAAVTAPDPAEGIEINLEPGAYVMPYRHYDPEKNEILDGPGEGEEVLCMRVIGPEEEGLSMLHVSGSYFPEWSDTPIDPGAIDTWFSSDSYMEMNPGADRLTLLKLIWKNVESCPPPGTADADPEAADITQPVEPESE